MSEEKYTERGFRIYADFIDTYGVGVCVVQSSLATDERVWVHVGATGSAHLNAEQAELVRDALNEWLREHA